MHNAIRNLEGLNLSEKSPVDVINRLPEDLIVHIATYSTVADVFALRQACRRLYSMTDSDYLWHQLLPRDELPLDIPPVINPRRLDASELRRSSLRALRLRDNWAKRNPKIRNLYNLREKSYDGAFDLLKLLNGAKTLVGIRRDRHSQRPFMIFCAYLLENAKKPVLAAQFSVRVTLKDFDACIDDQDGALILAATVKRNAMDGLQIYRTYLDNTLCTGANEVIYESPLAHGGIFHKVSLHGPFVASSIMGLPLENETVSCVLLSNWKTKRQITIFPRFENNEDLIDVKIVPPFLIIVAASSSTLQISVVPLAVISKGGCLESPLESRLKMYDLPEFFHVSTPLGDFYDICISDNLNFGPFNPATSLSLIAFPTLSRLEMRQNKKALHLRFSLDSTASELKESYATPPIQLEKSSPFDIPIGSYPEHAQLGSTGRRAVWLEQSLKSDYVKLLRLNFDPLDPSPSVEVLLPPDPQLPFKPSFCHALAFDETTGRLCVGLYNGAVYIVDYD